MLRSMRHEWEMSFAESGQEALDILAKKSCDVIVADIRMPGMDGAQLLSEVRKEHRTVRIILSGVADRGAILQAVGSAHQYLSKPCDAETLKSTLARAGALSGLLANDELRWLISQMESLPSLPSLYKRLVEELQSPEPSTEAIGQIVSRDMGMTAKILQLVNSTFSGDNQHVPSPTRAVTLLGLETVKTLAAHMFFQFDQTKLESLSLNSLWDHSVTTGAFAERIARAEGAEQCSADSALVAGLLHDVGKLVLAASFPEEYGTALALTARKGIGLPEAEKEVFGATHAEVGAYLLGLWGLSDPIVVATAFHHSPTRSQVKQFSPLTAVHIANVLEHQACSTNRIEAASQLDAVYLAELGLAERLTLWQKICKEIIQQKRRITNERENPIHR